MLHAAGAVALVQACKAAGLKTAVASSAGMVKVGHYGMGDCNCLPIASP